MDNEVVKESPKGSSNSSAGASPGPAANTSNVPGLEHDIKVDDNANLQNLKYITKNKKMSYYGASVQHTTTKSMNDIRAKLDYPANTRRVKTLPCGYYDSLVYPHRKSMYDVSINKSYIDNDLAMTISVVDKENEYNIEEVDKIFRIGDCNFIIPPEFITVDTVSSHDSIQAVRQSGSTHIKHGYSTKEIQANIVLNGMNQINGYEVGSPFSHKYYLDGLRTLISQLKYTPFTPIENNFVNMVHGVDNIALRNITVQTIPGFPETVNVILAMQEFNAEAYTCMANSILPDCIDWDLYRYYVQKPLQKGHPAYLEKITTPMLTNKFKFKILSDDAIVKSDLAAANAQQSATQKMQVEDDDLHINMFDDNNYVTMVTDEDEISLTSLTFSMGNIMPTMQLSAHESPTMQYLGATDTTFSFTFETRNFNTASMFNHIMQQNNYIVRTNRYKNGVGFIKLENELVQLTGTHFLLMTGVNVSTVPDFPDMHSITVHCVSFDANQKDREKLIGMRPFPGDKKGTRNDLISQSSKGIGNKIYQDSIIEQKIMQLELYPDMHLPTYKEVDYAITKINAWRTKNSLTPMHITKYPRQKMVLPGSIKETTYEGYVDPDFYVFYPNSFTDMEQTGDTPSALTNLSNRKSDGNLTNAIDNSNGNIMDMVERKQPSPDVSVEPEFAYGYENPEGTKVHRGFLTGFQMPGTGESASLAPNGSYEYGSGGGDPTKSPKQVKKITGNPFIDLLCDRADARCGYVFGGKGEIATNEVIDRLRRTSGGPDSFRPPNNPWKWLGKQVFDCSGFIWWGLRQIGMKVGYRTARNSASYGQTIPFNQAQPGDLGFTKKHVVVYLGNNKTVESKSTNDGVVYGKWDKKYTVVRISGLQEANQKFLQANPNFYKTTGNAASEMAPSSSESSGDAVLGNFTGSYSVVNKWNNLILKESKKYNFDPNFVKTFMAIESTGNPNAGRGKQYVGLMQISKDNPNAQPNPFDPEKNVYAAVKLLAEYGKPVGYDKKRWITAYNAGPNAEKRIRAGKKKLPKETRDFFAKYDRLYAQLMANGGKPGNTITPTDGGMTPPGGSANYSEADGMAAAANAFVWNYTDEDFRNPNRGKKWGNKPSSVDTSKFGEDFVSKVGTKSGGFDSDKISSEIKKLNDPEHVVEYMFVDAKRHSMLGSLARAFPSYIFMIIDEQADWVDEKKLWSNYYVSRNLIDASVHEAYDSPVHTMAATLSNFHNNLSKVMKSKTVEELGFDNYGGGIFKDAWTWLNKSFYKLTGAILDENITDKMIEYKNYLYDEINLEEGARVQLRLGYGSNPARYPVNFNGTITQLTDGELINIAAQSDGLEFTNNPLTDKTSATNKDIDLSDEVSNMISDLLIKRESNFIYTFTFGNFKIRSRYGIEHFGIHLNTLNVANYKQYDLVKNIYKGTYEGVPFCKNPFNVFDGESNFKFFATGKTPWDVMKMCEKAMPDFVAYPRYFNFESRLFYGLPIWLCKYKYNLDNSSGIIYEHAKSFSQVHEVSSLHSIIDNQIKIDTRDLTTNMIGLYTIGGDMASTPIIMSDNDIVWDKQSTRTIDTTSVQDFSWIPGFMDKFISWSGMFDNGKQLAISTCISELMYSWKDTYSGSIICMGRPEIHAHDFIYLDDAMLYMSGPTTVREVVHSLNVSTGLTSNIVPGLVANNTLKKSGMINVIKSFTSIMLAVALSSKAVLMSQKVFTKFANTYKSSRKAEVLTKGAGKAKNFTAGTGKKAFEYLKNGKIVTKTANFLKENAKMVSVAGKVKSLGTIAKTGYTAFKAACAFNPAGWPVLLATLAIDTLINKILNSVIEMFKYKNTIALYPVIIKKPDGSTRAHVGNVKGGKDILPYKD